MSSNNGPSTSAEVAASISPPAEAPRPKKNNAASQSLDEDQIAKAQQLNHVPQGEEYKKMISGMLYVPPNLHLPSKWDTDNNPLLLLATMPSSRSSWLPATARGSCSTSTTTCSPPTRP